MDQTQNDKGEMTSSVPIAMFHYIRSVAKNQDALGYNLSTDPNLFESELKWLKENGFATIHLANISLEGVPEKSIALTFDDGYEDFYTEAWPRLKKYGFTASIGIIVGRIDQSGYLTSDQIKELAESGIEIMSHSLTHPDLTKIDSEDLQKEIFDSKEQLEGKFGQKIFGFVYPSGKYNDSVSSAASRTGYGFALTTDPGIADLFGNHFKLKRVRIDNRDNLEEFISKMSGE